jgi:hypothetical protein
MLMDLTILWFKWSKCTLHWYSSSRLPIQWIVTHPNAKEAILWILWNPHSHLNPIVLKIIHACLNETNKSTLLTFWIAYQQIKLYNRSNPTQALDHQSTSQCSDVGHSESIVTSCSDLAQIFKSFPTSSASIHHRILKDECTAVVWRFGCKEVENVHKVDDNTF